MSITIDVIIKSDLNSVWEQWNNPDDIKVWNAASDDWHTTVSEVDLRVGGHFLSRMEAKDGSAGFDFKGTYSVVVEKSLIEYFIEDGRRVRIEFKALPGAVKVTEIFDAESVHSEKQQKEGWQSILNRFARHVEKSR